MIHCWTMYKIIDLELSLTKHRFWKENLPLESTQSPWTWQTNKVKRRGKIIPPPLYTYDVFIVKYATDQMLVTDWENVDVSYSIYTKKVDKSANSPQYRWQILTFDFNFRGRNPISFIERRVLKQAHLFHSVKVWIPLIPESIDF